MRAAQSRAGVRRAYGLLALGSSVAASPISWQHHLVWLVLPIAALVAAGHLRLAAGWAVLLIAPVTTLARQVDVPVLGALLVNTCGLTAVVATVLLPRLVQGPGRSSRRGGTRPAPLGGEMRPPGGVSHRSRIARS